MDGRGSAEGGTRYSAADIESMRSSVYKLIQGFSMIGFPPTPDPADVERRLVTHMNNGSTPEELEQIVEQIVNDRAKNWLAAYKIWKREKAEQGESA